MLFNSLKFAIFLPIVMALFWLSPARFRVPLLLIASYIFYMSWRPAYILLILGLTAFNYFAGLKISKSEKYKRHYLIAAITGNLSCLAFFKYTYFLDDLCAQILKPLAISMPPVPFDIILPLGISFFVFEFIHYVTDVYKGAQPVKSFMGFALFASFFPTQIAGPIKRFQDFMPQLDIGKKFSFKYVDEGVPLILTGLFKKVLIADNLSLFVMGGFTQPQLFTGVDLWIFTYAFAFQIYFDFSGYTDIARGAALLFGYKVPINFNLPYLASSVSEFWQRWHISLSTWLRDYLFIPLGGSRCSRAKTYRNLLITMTLGGLWHGAAMHFLAWGAYQGVMLVLNKEFERFAEKTTFVKQFFSTHLGKAISILVTFHFVCIGWVLFRAETSNAAQTILSKILFLSQAVGQTSVFALNLPAINYPLIYSSIYLLLPLLFIAHVAMAYAAKKNLLQRSPVWLKTAYCVALMFAVITLAPDKSPRFIYFQF